MENHQLAFLTLAHHSSSSSARAGSHAPARGDGHTPVHGSVTSVAWPSETRSFSFASSHSE
ncbi:uncharacterized protein METZ01_LOCUS474079, partial [marine metagenome]